MTTLGLRLFYVGENNAECRHYVYGFLKAKPEKE